MKHINRARTGLLATVICFGLLMPVGAAAFLGCIDYCMQDDPGSFRGILWGQARVEVPGMKYVGLDPDDEGVLYYQRSDEPLQIGNAKLESIYYGFWRDIFSSAYIVSKGENNWKALKRACFERFGMGRQANTFVERYYWAGRHSYITLAYDDIHETGRLFIYSRTLAEMQREAHEKIARENLKAGF